MRAKLSSHCMGPLLALSPKKHGACGSGVCLTMSKDQALAVCRDATGSGISARAERLFLRSLDYFWTPFQ